MSKLAKRILLITAAVMLVLSLSIIGSADGAGDAQGPVCYLDGDVNGDGIVNNKDAIYTLYNYLLGDNRFPVNQDADFNDDGVLNNKDAIFVLYAYMLDNDPVYKLDDVIHSYYDPVWNWSENSATVTASVSFKCGCGIPATYTVANGVTVSLREQKAATCVEAGYAKYLAAITLDGKDYTAEKTVVLPAGEGHAMVGTTNCESGSHCSLCDYKELPLGHTWQKGAYTAASCTANAVQAYSCACGATKNVEEEGTAGHTLSYMGDAHVSGCQYVKKYICSVCSNVFDGTAPEDTFYIHSYAATLEEATCVKEGKKTYSCSVCGTPGDKVETVPVNNSHHWVEDGSVNGVTSYRCDRTGCNATKTTVSVDNNSTTDKAALQSAQELQLAENTTIALDEEAQKVLDDNRDIKITVEKIPVASLDLDSDLTDDQKEQIGNNPVFDFNMVYTDNLEKVSNFGENAVVTVSLPYTLQPGDDVDSIDVWFIADDGTLTQVEGTYANGYVTFTTNHFSYYTVIRLTAAQRCERYGHIEITTAKAPTCTEDGYTVITCQRCGVERSKVVTPKVGHSYKITGTPATCIAAGTSVNTCGTCGHTVTTEIPATGHNIKLDHAQTVVASCTQAGLEVLVCSNSNCSYHQRSSTPQLAHNYQAYEQKDATCTEKGYKTQKCSGCEAVITVSETAPLGHEFLYENASWSWSEDYTAALTLTCSHDSSHTVKLNAVISTTSTDGGCAGTGNVTYTATVSYNSVTYTDTRSQSTPPVGHKPEGQWSTSTTHHFHLCSVCHEPLDSDAHSWNDGTVVTQATCDKPGSMEYICSVCNYKKTSAIPATREHVYENGICTGCGREETACSHITTSRTKLDTDAMGICEGASVYLMSCSCGETQTYMIDILNCNFGDVQRTTLEDDYGSYEANVSTCADCGLTCTTYQYMKIEEDPCFLGTMSVSAYSMNGTELFRDEYSKMDGNHRTEMLYETVDLSQYGLCGEVLEIFVCPCEKYQNTSYLSYERKCDWQYDPDNSSKFVEAFRCTVCGARRTEEYLQLEPEFQCQYIHGYRYTYYFGDEQVYTYDNITVYNDHPYIPGNAQLLGESCEDGVIVEFACNYCGNTQEVCMFYHCSIPQGRVDTKDLDICYDAIVQYGCPCGAYLTRWRSEGDNQCEWETVSESDTGATYRCRVCNAIREETFSKTPTGNQCEFTEASTVIFKDRNGSLLATINLLETTIYHDFTVTYDLYGTNCTDGVEVIYSCKNCDYNYSYVDTDHFLSETASYDVSQHNLCFSRIRIYACPCGSQSQVYYEESGCDWQYVISGPNSSLFRCTNCGVERTMSYTTTQGADKCHIIRQYTVVLSKDGQELLTFHYNENETSHASIYTFQLNPGAQDCTGGYTVTENCMYCNYSSSSTHWGSDHQAYVTARQEFQQDSLCGKTVLNTYSCACGKSSYSSLSWEDGYCQFINYAPDETYGTVAICDICGGKRATVFEVKPDPSHPCVLNRINHIIYMDANGNVLFSYDECSSGYNHNYVYSYRSTGGTSCNDGYVLIGTCTRCNASYEEETFGCNPYAIEEVVLADLEGMCGTTKLIHNRCFCGAKDDWTKQDPCNWMEYQDDQEICRNCGAIRSISEIQSKLPGSCQMDVTLDCTTTMDEETVHKQHSYTTSSHTLVFSFRIDEGATCENGFYVDSHCIYCDHSTMGEELIASAIHQTYTVERYDLDLYGGCSNSAYIAVEQCACGANANVDLYTGNCNMYPTGNSDVDTQAPEYYCETCQCYLYFNETEQIDRNNCTKTVSAYFKVVKDGEVKKEVTRTFDLTTHDYTIVSSNFAPYGPGSDCLNGVDLTLRCLVCETTTTKYVAYHEVHTVEYVDLAQMGACGGNITHLRCACGDTDYINKNFSCQNFSTNIEKTEMGADGHEHSIWSVTCNDCGLTRTEDFYDVKIEGVCNANRFRTITVTLDGTTKSFSEKTQVECHGKGIPLYYEPVTEALCGNGFTHGIVCNDCHQTIGSVSLGSHSTTSVMDIIQLASYGSVCGGQIEITTCKCGKAKSWNFSDDTACDFTGQPTLFFVENALPDYFQQSVMGSQTYNQEAYQYYCAVTDPLCNMKIRAARYWVAGKNCTAKEMITLQLGYDPATDTFIREFTFETGETGFYHTYESESFDGKQDDGVTYYGDTYTCTTCGSTHTSTVYHKPTSDYWWKSEDIFVNTLNDGNYKTLTVTEYQTVDGDHVYLSQRDRVYTTAAGEEVQEWYTYSFNFENNCTRTETFRDSLGNTYTNVIPDYHQYNWYHKTLKDPTCSQPGIRNDQEKCDGCGKVVQDQNFTMSPTGHNLCYNEETGLYVCDTCGLESITGGNGSVILEDMTATHGTGTQAVIGYYNGTESNLNVHLSVILEDIEDADNQIDLSFTDFIYLDDEITAVSFDMAAAQAVAAEAIGDYTGAYALRISFVPTDNSQLEYAITFDSQMAE